MRAAAKLALEAQAGAAAEEGAGLGAAGRVGAEGGEEEAADWAAAEAAEGVEKGWPGLPRNLRRGIDGGFKREK